MSHLRGAQQPLRLFGNASRQPYICRSCRANAIRQFHSSTSAAAEVPFFKRIQQTLFGSQEAKEAQQKQEEEAEKRSVELAKNDAARKRTRKAGGRVYELAPVVNQSVNKDYVPSSTWHGLERIGGRQYVKAKADRGEKYVGFMPPKRLQLSDKTLVKLLHHITIEVLALQKAGRDLDEVCFARSTKGRDWQRSRHAVVTFESANGDASLRFKSPQDEELVLQAIPQRPSDVLKSVQEEVTEPEQVLPENPTQEPENAGSPSPSLTTPPVPASSPTATHFTSNQLAHLLAGALSQYPEGETSWMSTPLQDPKVKLTIVKRMMQLTGHRIPDLVISNANTLLDLHNSFKAKEKPKKLAYSEELQRLKTEIPNVAVHATRRTPIQKEKEVGRWKLIEDELVARDLPVTGSRWRESKPQVGL